MIYDFLLVILLIFVFQFCYFLVCLKDLRRSIFYDQKPFKKDSDELHTDLEYNEIRYQCTRCECKFYLSKKLNEIHNKFF